METYVSKSVRISQSRSHENMFIFEFEDGTFFSIASSVELVQKTHPADNSKFNRDYKQFLKTSNYNPQSAGFTSSIKQNRSYAKQSKN